MKNIKLKMARVEKDLSQEELAQIVGVSRQTIGLIELGKYNPSLSLCVCHMQGIIAYFERSVLGRGLSGQLMARR